MRSLGETRTMRDVFETPESELETHRKKKRGRNTLPRLVLGLITFPLAIGVSIYSSIWLLGWAASLPMWEPAIEASKELGRTAENYEFLFFCLTIFLPHGLIAAVLVFVCSKISSPWFAVLGYFLSLVYIVTTFGRFSYDWFAPALSITTLVFSIGTAYLVTRKKNKNEKI